jgi:PQQ-dependent dehydrogenase (methanol/ethanol family)
LENTRHVPWTDINSRNVSRLALVWRFNTGVYGRLETSPVVVGDTMYVTTGPDNSVIALDARSGELKWRYTPQLGFTAYIFAVNRGVAVDGGKVFYATLDGRLIALDARTGKPRWRVQVGSPLQGFSETMAPLAWKGKVFIGSSGGEFGIRGSFTAYAQSDGTMLWRWYSVSRGWEGRFVSQVHGVLLHRDISRERANAAKFSAAWMHGGGPIWMTPALDVRRETIYLSTGNPSPPYNADQRPGDNLYTDSIVALNANTGKLKWFYQETPHDVWDYDAASPPLLFDALDRAGRRVAAVGEAGKTGWFYIVDRDSGRLLRVSEPFVPQHNVYARPASRGVVVEPGESGGAIGPLSYDPSSHQVFIGAIVAKEAARSWLEKPWQAGGRKWLGGEQHWLAQGNGNFAALNVDTGKLTWRYKARYPIIGGSLSAADLVFVGEEGTAAFDAFDVRSGKLLWRYQPNVSGNPDPATSPPLRYLKGLWARLKRRLLNEPVPESDSDIHAPPVAYKVANREYIAIAADQPFQVDNRLGDAILAFALR